MKRILTLLILFFALLRQPAAASGVDTLGLTTNALNKGELPLLVLHPEKLMAWMKSNNFTNPEPAIPPAYFANTLDNGELPFLVLNPGKLMTWTKSNNFTNLEPTVSPVYFANVLNKENLPLFTLHPEKFIVWTKSNHAIHPDLPGLPNPFSSILNADGLSLLVLKPEKLMAWAKSNDDIDNAEPSTPVIFITNTLKGVPGLVNHPELLTIWSMPGHVVSPGRPISLIPADSLKMPVIPFKSIVILKPPTAAPRLQNFKQQIKVFGLDSLKSLVKTTTSDSLKVLLYTEIANRYVANDTLSDKTIRTTNQTEALTYTMKALHLYSHYGDTTGLRMCYDNLAKVYFAQKKLVQAKWFILQSNSLSRARNDVPNVIASLLILAAVKSEIKDDKLALRDLDEALKLSITKHYPKIELDVLKTYALYYSRLQNYTKEAQMIKKRDSLLDSMHKKEEEALLAKVASQDSAQKKKLDSLTKKKIFTSNTRKLYKNASGKKIASL